MEKRNRIIYWIATGWLSLGMLSTGMVQLLGTKDEAAVFARLGYPAYLMTLLGICKLLGTFTVLVPRFPLLKEWAYAGFFFTMSGAIFSHLFVKDGAAEFFGPSLLLVLTIVSWYFRPANRKLVTQR